MRLNSSRRLTATKAITANSRAIIPALLQDIVKALKPYGFIIANKAGSLPSMSSQINETGCLLVTNIQDAFNGFGSTTSAKQIAFNMKNRLEAIISKHIPEADIDEYMYMDINKQTNVYYISYYSDEGWIVELNLRDIDIHDGEYNIGVLAAVYIALE